ncbi:hypothetical protein V7150_02490 [Neobacillus drentensis]|uniref:hypothetical protein n=1 Tax=Neobacillus drentensis TaxID=220684 RepID=UPI002FFEB033
MIPDHTVVKFLKRTEPLFIHLAVSNVDRHPISVRGFGVKIDDRIDCLNIYILKAQTEKVLSYLSSGNGVVACLFTDGFSNESYQIIGRFINYKASIREDLEILTGYRKSSLKLFPKMYAKFPLSTAICDVISYKAEEIFVQTPGPYAGSKYQKGEATNDS